MRPTTQSLTLGLSRYGLHLGDASHLRFEPRPPGPWGPPAAGVTLARAATALAGLATLGLLALRLLS